MAENITKNARKRSEDPVQESLRQHKDEWNGEASLLIAQLIAFKRGLNGRGEPRVGLPPSSIKNPLPNEVAQYLEQLTTRYEQLITDARNIIHEQENYANNRKKSQKELAEMGVTSGQIDELTKYSSWWGSRVWTYVKNYTSPKYWLFGEEDIKDRMNILSISVRVTQHFENIENHLVSKDEDSIALAVHEFLKYTEIFNKLLLPKVKGMVARHAKNAITESDTAIVENQPTEIGVQQSEQISEPLENKQTDIIESEIQPTDLSGKISDYEPKNQIDIETKQQSNVEVDFDIDVDIDKVIEIQKDLLDASEVIRVMSLFGTDQTIILKSKSLLKKIKSLADSVKIIYRTGKHLKNENDLKLLKQSYSQLLNTYSELNNLCSDAFGFPQGVYSFATLSNKVQDKLKTKAELITDAYIYKLAHNYLSRWFNRQRLKVFPSSTEQLKLQAVNKVLILIDNADKFQDVLEDKESSVFLLTEKLKDIALNSASFVNDLHGLALIYNSQYEEDRLETKITRKQINENSISRLNKALKQFEEISRELMAKGKE
jgi:hypothetical protein